MKWLEFKPTEGILRAEGNGWVLTSTQLRSVGCVVNIQPYYTPSVDRTHMMVSTQAANLTTFGILSTGPFESDDFPIGNLDHVLRWMRHVRLPSQCLNILKELEGDGSPLYGFVDLIPMLSTFVRQRQSMVMRVPAPIAKPYGILHSRTGRVSFAHQLQRLRNENSQMNGGLIMFQERWDMLTSSEASKKYVIDRPIGYERSYCWLRPEDVRSAEWNGIDLEYLELVHDTWDWTTQRMAHLCKGISTNPGLLLLDIVLVHVQHSVLAHAQAEKTGETYVYKTLDFELRDWHSVSAETMHLWFEGLQSMHRDFLERSDSFQPYVEYETFVELWLLAVLKGMCWDSAHYMVDGMRVGSEHLGSRMPIYIG